MNPNVIRSELLRSCVKIKWCRLVEVLTNTEFWRTSENLMESNYLHIANLPAELLDYEYIRREICFQSTVWVHNFKMIEKVRLSDLILSSVTYDFGRLEPHHLHIFSSLLYSPRPEDRVPLSALNGNCVVEAKFYEYNNLITTSYVETFYS